MTERLPIFLLLLSSFHRRIKNVRKDCKRKKNKDSCLLVNSCHTHHNHLLTIYLLFYMSSTIFSSVWNWQSTLHQFTFSLPNNGNHCGGICVGKQEFYFTMAVWNISFPISMVKWCSLSLVTAKICGGNGHLWQYFPWSQLPSTMSIQAVVTGVTWTINYLWKTCLCWPSTHNAQLFSLVNSPEYLWCCLFSLLCGKCC